MQTENTSNPTYGSNDFVQTGDYQQDRENFMNHIGKGVYVDFPLIFNDDLEVVSYFVKTFKNYVDASENLNQKREYAELIAENAPLAVCFLPNVWREDKAINLLAVSSMGVALERVLDLFKDDDEIVRAAVQNDGGALEFASARLKQDREIAILALNNNGRALEFVSDEIKDNDELVFTATKKQGWATLRYASERLRDDRDFVLRCMVQNGINLQGASDRLKNDLEVCKTAARHGGMECLMYASPEVQKALDYDVNGCYLGQYYNGP